MKKKNNNVIPELKLYVKIDSVSGNIYWKELRDNYGNDWGEYIDYWENGNIKFTGFNKMHKQIGIWIKYKEDGSLDCYYYFSIINIGEVISEQDYKKELAMLRLGLIECPEFDILIKDYEKDFGYEHGY